MKHLDIKVKGRVQGVGYRFECLRMANALSIRGFVKNKADGSVYIEAEGAEPNVKDFIQWCKKGPPTAQVDDIEIEENEVKNYTAFDIQR